MTEVHKAIVDNAVRWCSNILVEVLSNYGEWMGTERRNLLKTAVHSLGEFQTRRS